MAASSLENLYKAAQQVLKAGAICVLRTLILPTMCVSLHKCALCAVHGPDSQAHIAHLEPTVLKYIVPATISDVMLVSAHSRRALRRSMLAALQETNTWLAGKASHFLLLLGEPLQHYA